VDIVSPAGLTLEIDRIARGEVYRPRDLQGTDVVVRPLTPHEVDEGSRAFVNQAGGERWRDFRERLNALIADTERVQVQAVVKDGQVVIVFAIRRGQPTEIPLARVRRSAVQHTLVRHALAWIRQQCSKAPAAVTMTDKSAPPVVERALQQEGFIPSPSGYAAFVVPGAGTRDDLAAAVAELVAATPQSDVPPGLIERVEAAAPGPRSAFELEAMFHPYAVLEWDLPTFLVPIKAEWAAQLVDPSIARLQLFRRETALALQREHVYYRSPRASGGLSAPARILWYVSGLTQPGRMIRAVSHLEEVMVGDAGRLFERFAHLGVYGKKDVERTADGGEVMALRFTRTRALKNPVPLKRYRNLLAREGIGLALAGPQPLIERIFEDVVSMAA
jgi:hypothetical protein